MRPVWHVVVAVAFSLAATPARAQQLTVSAGLDPGTTVDIQLENLRFRTALPFDVQFFVRAPIAEDVVEVQGKVARKRSNLLCPAVIDVIPTMAPLSTFAEPGIRVVPARRTLGGPAPAAPVSPVAPRTTPVPTPAQFPGWLGYAGILTDEKLGRVFELSVPPLKPRKDYCFAFVLRMKAEAGQASQIITAALDTELRRILSVEKLSPSTAYDEFRRRVVAAIDDIRIQKQEAKQIPLIIEVPERSFFDLNVPADQVLLNYRLAFNAVVQEQFNRTDTLQGIRDRSDEAQAALSDLFDDEAFGRLLAALRLNANDSGLSPRLSGIRGVLDLGTQDQSAMSQGADAGGQTLVGIGAVWTSAELAPRVAQLGVRIGELNAFKRLVDQLQRTPTLFRAAGLAPATPPAAANPNAVSVTELAGIGNKLQTASETLDLVRDEMSQTQSALDDRFLAISRIAADAAAALERDVRFSGTTMTDWKTRATAYISADVGLAYSGGIDSFFYYLGTNVYLGPVNKKAPLSFQEDGLVSSIRKRFAIMFGIPINSFDDEETVAELNDERVDLEGVIGNRPLLIGAGFRLTDLIRITGGSVFFKVRDPNPLITDLRTRHSAFFAVSVDWDIRGFFAGLGGQSPVSASRK